MHPKLAFQKKSNELNPGPGHYSSISTLNATGKYIVSTVVNTPGTRITTGKMYDPTKSWLVPGPGAYNTDKENLNTTGNFFNSRHESSRCRTFSKSQRKDEAITSRRKLPGPGSYNFFSDFGSKIRKWIEKWIWLAEAEKWLAVVKNEKWFLIVLQYRI